MMPLLIFNPIVDSARNAAPVRLVTRKKAVWHDHTHIERQCLRIKIRYSSSGYAPLLQSMAG